MATIENIETKFEKFVNTISDLGDIQALLKVKNDATPEQKSVAQACKVLPPAQREAVLNTLSPESKEIISLLTKASELPQDSAKQMRIDYFNLIDALEEFRQENGKFKRPYSRKKKTN